MNNVRRVQTIIDRFHPDAWTASERTCGGTIALTRADAVGMILVEDLPKIAALFPGYIAYVTTQAKEHADDELAIWLTPRSTTMIKGRKPRKPDRRAGDRRASARRISDKAKRRLRR